VKGRPSAKSRGLKRTDRIVSIDMSGPETAFVKLECSIHPRYFTDYLTLLKLKDGWKVVSKTSERTCGNRPAHVMILRRRMRGSALSAMLRVSDSATPTVSFVRRTTRASCSMKRPGS
jgi:C-terminal processing protease CtpA/Prc